MFSELRHREVLALLNYYEGSEEGAHEGAHKLKDYCGNDIDYHKFVECCQALTFCY